MTHYYFEECVYWTPFSSDPAVGRMGLRDIVDIRTGEPVPNRYAGVPVPKVVRDALDPEIGIYPHGGEMAEAKREATALVAPGHVDSIANGIVRGWAWDPERPKTSVAVEFREGDVVLGIVRADSFRSDLLRAGIGNGCHGFACALSYPGAAVSTVRVVETGALLPGLDAP